MVTKAAVVTKTVRAMAPDEVLQLLSALTDRLQSRPVRSQGLHTWLRPLLLHHASYLTAAPGEGLLPCPRRTGAFQQPCSTCCQMHRLRRTAG